ncbi:MAG: hypothetical protein RLZZ241_275 [Bacteroidota bacterium]|jgi:hypothetical protein
MKKLIGFLAIASLFTCSQDNLSEVLGENGSGTVRLSVKLDQSFLPVALGQTRLGYTYSRWYLFIGKIGVLDI